MNTSMYEFGKSPFRTKGSLYRGLITYVKTLDANPERALAAFRDRLESPVLREFLEQSFLPGSWYDLLPNAALTEVVGKMAGLSPLDAARAMTRMQFHTDVRGIHRLLLHFVSPQSVVERLVRLMSQYFDFGSAAVIESDSRRVIAVARGIPRVLSLWYGTIASEYFALALKASGAKQIEVVYLGARPDGSAHGMPLDMLTFRSTWT